MTAFATPDDVAAAWRPLTDAEEEIAVELLAYAAAIIRNEYPSIDDRIAAGTMDAALVKGVNRSMVLRAMKNPDGVRTVTEQHSIDDYSESTTRTTDAALSTGEIYLADGEKVLLKGRRSKAFSITPSLPCPTAAVIDQAAANRARWGR